MPCFPIEVRQLFYRNILLQSSESGNKPRNYPARNRVANKMKLILGLLIDPEEGSSMFSKNISEIAVIE
jgi:hypothetical protein